LTEDTQGVILSGMPEDGVITLGERLRKLRNDQGLSLRQVERMSGINNGYLSQLERDEIGKPNPSVLQKLAAAYDESMGTLMRWAGYIEETEKLSPNQQRALRYLGDDPTDEEVETLKAVLNVLRTRGSATFASASSLDLVLADEDHQEIHDYAVRLLQEVDALGNPPTPVDDVIAFSKLVKAGEVTLTLDEKRGLRARFGHLVDKVLTQLQGVIHFNSRQVWINPDIDHEGRKRFVTCHEVGHYILPAHRETFAYLDDHARLKPDVLDLFERQANQASVELLAQGDGMRKEFDGSLPSVQTIERLANRYVVSLQATARRVTETSRQRCAVAIAFRGYHGDLKPPHLYCSPAFEQRLRWKTGEPPRNAIQAALIAGAHGWRQEPIAMLDVHDQPVTLRLEAIENRYAVIVLFALDPAPRRGIHRFNPFLGG
jgi:HTH-type transcriptional regulator, competence development regulator